MDSDDVRAANEAKRYLDYRITTAVIDAAETKRILRRAKEALPRLSLRAILPLLPVFAVATRSAGDVCLTGLGLPRSDPPVLDALRRLHIRSPIADAFAGTRGSRDLVRAAATSLGLPVRWARVRHRGPLAGAGIAAFVESVDVEEALKGSSPGS